MISTVLQQIATLRADLAVIDPTRQSDAADSIAAIAVALREHLAEAEKARPATKRGSRKRRK